MEIPKAADVKKGISVLWDTLQCPICLDLMAAPVSTKCDHQFCKFCMMKLLNNTKQNKANCPVCKSKITKRSLQESPGFQRLVAGLQEMILAYENDTGLNYFTGMSRQNQRPEATYTKGADCHNEVSVGDAPCSEPDNEEDVENGLPQSHSSTVAAKNGFAILMGLEDTGPLTADNDGLDSGLGEAPPTSDKQMFSPADVMETELPEVQRTPSACKTRVKKKVSNMKEAPIQPSLIQDAPEHLGRCSKKKPKRQLESDKILDQKQKKSLEKVAEWLMKVPTQGSLELEKPNEDGDDSDGCSSTSTIDVPQINYVSATRGDRAKALEEQVFGAIYRRERKGNRTVCLPRNIVGKATKPTETATETVCSAEFYKDASTRDMKEEHSMIEEKDTNSDILKEQTEILEGNCKEGFVEELTNVPESDKDEVVCPMSDIEQQQPETEPKTMTRTTMQKVDNDLFNQSKEKSENTEQNKKQTKRNKRRSKNIKPEKANPARVTNPLVLVTVENGETSPKIRPEEVQVHIENYPSSEDQEVPVARSTRRSSRLQVFTREVQEGHKKVNMRAKVPKKERNVANRSANPENVVLKNVLSSNSRRSKRNGCIYNQDIGEIENMESAERTSCVIPDKDAKESASEVPNSETLSEARAGCYAPVVPSSKTPTEAAVNPTNHFPISTWVEKKFTAIENENEEDRNDSEIDTEQLVRSFKTSKRKSFHLGGGADVKRSRCSDQESVEAEENQHVPFGSEPAQICPEITNKQVLSGIENLSCSDLISQSNSPGLIRKTVVEKPDQVVEEASIPDESCSDSDGAVDNPVIGNTVSSQLPPNRVSKCNVESPCLSLMPKVGDSGLCFTTIIPSQTPQNQPDCTMREDTQDRETAGQVLNTESSLTPDGLVMPVAQFAHETKAYSQGSGELSTHSSVKITSRKRTRVQRLESSSDSSDCTKEELPALAKIFGTSATVTRDQEGHAEAGRCEGVPAVRREQLNHPPACLSPDCVDSSQVSVDLFGTPDECEAVINDPGVSMDSSQFSSEVLVTQQKIEMQKELMRLEKLMALVSEVLQEKEASPTKDVPSKTNQNGEITGADIHKPLPHDQKEVSKLKTLPEAEQEPNMRCSDVNGVAHPAGSKPSNVAEIAARHSINADSRTSRKLGSSSAAKTINSNGSPSEGQEDKENSTPEKGRNKAKMVLVSSGLGPSEQVTVKKFARQIDARVVSQVTPEVTHVIMHTDEQLVCERTLKYFLGIAGRKWVVSFQWISECFKQKKLLNESSFEVRGDVVNGSNHQGPMKARTTEDDNLLMKDYKICFHGPFTDMTTDNLEWMVELCGATVVKDPLLLDAKQKDHQLVIVPSGSEPASTYSSLSRQATVVTRGWLLDTVATYTIQNHKKYTAELRAP